MIPVGITMEGLDELMKRSYLFTFVGAVLGLIIGGFAFVFETIFPPQISAVFIIASIYYLTGLNHLDGLADFGDGATNRAVKTLYSRHMLSEGFIAGGHFYIMYSHTESDINECVCAFTRAIKRIDQSLKNRTLMQEIDRKPSRPVYQRLT